MTKVGNQAIEDLSWSWASLLHFTSLVICLYIPIGICLVIFSIHLILKPFLRFGNGSCEAEYYECSHW